MNRENHGGRSSSSSSSSSNSSSSMSNDEEASNNDDDDDRMNNAGLNENDVDCQSVPNLSIFEQHSSNNDSSLTSVTCTSGENSFEISSTHDENEITSDNNNLPDMLVKNSMEHEKQETSDSELPSQDIPCLSALRQ